MRITKVCNILHTTLPQRVEDVAKTIGVSKRSVQRDISYLRKVSKDNGFSVITKRGQGVYIQVTDQQAFDRWLDKAGAHSSFVKDDRYKIILQMLALKRSWVTAAELADALYVSRNVIFTDLVKTEELASHYSLALDRTTHWGIRIYGSNFCIKQYLVNEYQNGSELVVNRFNDLKNDFVEVERVLKESFIQEGINVNISEFEYMEAFLLASIQLATTDWHEGDTCGLVNSLDEDQTSEEVIARRTLCCMQDIYNVKFCEQDVCDFMGIIKDYVPNVVKKDMVANDVKKRAIEFLRQCDEQHGTSYLSDKPFVDMLLAHLVFLTERLTRNVSYTNPQAQEITITNPENTNLAIHLCNRLSLEFGLNPTPDEVSFIATYFAAHDERMRQNRIADYAKVAVVCSTGGGAALLVRMQLNAIFSNAEVRSFSHLDQALLKDYAPDIVFSMVELVEKINAPCIYIREVLTTEDIALIREIVRNSDLDESPIEVGRDFVWDLIRPELFERTQFDSYEQILKHMSNKLIDLGYADKDFLDLVLKREKFSSTIYNNGVCLPHPLETHGIKDGLAVVILDDPIYVNGREVAIVFLVCLTHEKVNLYKPLSSRMYRCMSNKTLIDKLKDARTSKELIEYLNELDGVADE